MLSLQTLVRGRPEFSQAYISYTGREGVKGRRTHLKKCCLRCIATLTRGLKINIFKVLLVGRERVTKKSTLCTPMIMLTILDDTLGRTGECENKHVARGIYSTEYPLNIIFFGLPRCQVSLSQKYLHVWMAVSDF